MGTSLTPGPNYGDMTKLQNMRQSGGTKREAGTSGATVQKNPVGRPATAPLVPVTPYVAPTPQEPQFQVPPEHKALMQRYAKASLIADYWAEKANTSFGAGFENLFARVSAQNVARIAATLKQNTPDFTV